MSFHGTWPFRKSKAIGQRGPQHKRAKDGRSPARRGSQSTSVGGARLSSSSEPAIDFEEGLAAAASEGSCGAVAQGELGVAIAGRGDADDGADLNDLAAVSADKSCIQALLEYHVVRAADGKPISRTQHVQVASQLGGFQNLGGYADGLVYQHGSDRIGPPVVDAPYNGTLMALSPDGASVVWRFDRMSSPVAAGIAIANGVIYVQSPVEEAEGHSPESAIYALDAKTGVQLTPLRTPGRTLASVAISDGRLYIGGGNRAVPDIDHRRWRQRLLLRLAE
jgi:hypothetical protein